ncbi:segregation and condensation protein B [Eggerthia catenaformis OT 569 = DSM 20559]|uniref:Segregation and condensation protein B n=1 Tax=Eggerthia catenaformis OT 569 = DSM 20559 TaxID=999415 RepID=M2PA84_9FIRM|nr:SMC-Scp complex subunit ScpB [Eggerthia catenaformis]EMD17282.1 segregation and condensation protein B [Eggerthia catenaformis OT 569 = DSM 20559]OUC51490.1 SMC-Scp complex subunit ScpB [Eggerthia catenaformis]
MDHMNYLSVIEGMIFLSGDEGMSIKDIMNTLDISKKEAVELLDELMNYYSQKEIKGFDITCFGGIYRMTTLASHDQYYAKMMAKSSSRISKSALETLAIIAYYQPISRISVEEIRGVGCEAMIRKLLAKALIKEVGREETPGRPILYGVTDEFMNAFQLTSLEELPKLKEIKNDFDEDDLFNTKYKESSE